MSSTKTKRDRAADQCYALICIWTREITSDTHEVDSKHVQEHCGSFKEPWKSNKILTNIEHPIHFPFSYIDDLHYTTHKLGWQESFRCFKALEM